MFKVWHLLVLVVVIFACIWASNNITIVQNIVG
jgi:hypothetical protein